MPPFLVPGLGKEEASNICMNHCRAMCCRGPLLLELASEEVDSFLANGERLQVEVRLNRGMNEAAWLKFADHEGERCPMLDPDSFACRIYEDRPARCREFPVRKTPGCAISGG